MEKRQAASLRKWAPCSGGRYSVSELAKEGFGAVAFAVHGRANLDLPLYFPTESLPLGGSDKDRNADGHPDNSLRVSTGFDLKCGFHGIHVVVPNFKARSTCSPA